MIRRSHLRPLGLYILLNLFFRIFQFSIPRISNKSLEIRGKFSATDFAIFCSILLISSTFNIYFSSRNSWSKTASLLVSDSKKKWKRYNAPLFHHNIGYSFKSIRPNEILPLCLFLVIFGSAVFSIFALNNALNKSAWRNNKYDSIEFGHLKTLEKEANSDLRSSAIVDENGNFLGGKKASIQFAYDMTKTGDPKVSVTI